MTQDPREKKTTRDMFKIFTEKKIRMINKTWKMANTLVIAN